MKTRILWVALGLFLLQGLFLEQAGAKVEPNLKEAAFAAGCFWGVEKIMGGLPGVVSTDVGYMGGTGKNPTYEEVCGGRTGHAETVRVLYDPSKVRYEELLITFWKVHDPTTLNRQGPDIGSQYRSVVFFYDEAQKETAERSKKILSKDKIFALPIVTEIIPASKFYMAEEYHQDYLKKDPNGYCSHHLQSSKIEAVLSAKLL